MKKILFVISSLSGGGAERVLSVMVKEFFELGFEICIATNLNKNVMYSFNNVTYYDIPHINSGNKISNAYSKIKKISSAISFFNPDIIIPMLTKTAMFTILANLAHRKKLIVSEHSVFTKTSSFGIKLTRKFLYKLANHVVVLNTGDLVLAKRSINHVSIIPNPCSFKPISLEDYNLIEKKNIVLVVASLNRYKSKGVDKVILMWSNIIKEYPDWELHILGTGSQSNIDILNALIQAKGVSDSVFLDGFSSDVELWYRKSSILVVASDMECLPMAIIEAMSQGCSVISFDCDNGPRDIITDHFNGVLVENNNLEMLELSLTKLISRPDLRKKISINALLNMSKYEAKQVMKQWVELF